MTQLAHSYEIEGIPYGVAMGGINGTSERLIRQNLESMLASPAGLATFGSIGTRFNEGNGGTPYFHDPETGETLNGMALPGIGIDAAEPLITEYSRKFADARKLLIVGASALRGEDPAEVLPLLMERIFEAGALVGEADYGCPNLVKADGGREPILGYDVPAMEYVRARIVERIGASADLREKLPPYVGEYFPWIPEVAATYSSERRLGNVGVTGFNSIPGVVLRRDGKPVLRLVSDVDGQEVVSRVGGLSGPAVADSYSELQHVFLSYLPDGIPFIAAGGVWSGQDVKDRVNDPRVQAATAVTRFWEGEKVGFSYGRTATQVAEEFAEAI